MADQLQDIVSRMVAGGESEDDIAGVIQHYNATAAPRRPVSAEDFTPNTQPEGSAAGRFLSNAGEMLNPLAIVKAAGNVMLHPVDTASSLVAAQYAQGKKAFEDAKAGRGWEAVGHGMAAALPLLGPAAAAAGEQIGTGDVAGGLGKAAGMLAPMALGAALPAEAEAPALLKNANPVAADAVELAQRSGVPLDAGTATGNRFVKAIQHVSDSSLGGSMVAGKAAQAQADGLATLGEQLASKGYATPVSAEQAGEGVRDAVLGQVKIHASDADAAYDGLRKIEADPANAKAVPGPNGSTQLMPLPVNLDAAKTALRPLYDELSRQAELTPAAMMGDKARALNALDKIMSGPSHAPLSTVDAVLGDLKSFARSDVPELKTAGQGAAQGAIRHLDAVVQQTAQDAGPQAVQALKMGRGATVAKYQAADVLDGLNAEPVKTIARLTSPKDGAIEQLRAVASQAPGALPQIGRSFIDDLLSTATAEGGFGRGAGIAQKWASLGPQTKALLYQDPAYVKDLDSFFHLAKMAADTPNPSGTAHTVLSAGQGALIMTNPLLGGASVLGTAMLSKLLHSPVGVKLLTRGMRIPVANTAASAAWAADLAAATSPSVPQSPSTVPAR